MKALRYFLFREIKNVHKWRVFPEKWCQITWFPARSHDSCARTSQKCTIAHVCWVLSYMLSLYMINKGKCDHWRRRFALLPCGRFACCLSPDLNGPTSRWLTCSRVFLGSICLILKGGRPGTASSPSAWVVGEDALRWCSNSRDRTCLLSFPRNHWDRSDFARSDMFVEFARFWVIAQHFLQLLRDLTCLLSFWYFMILWYF